MILGALGALPAASSVPTTRCVPDLDVDAACQFAYGTIQGAIDAAQPGDVVRVGPGAYEESVVIDKTLTLMGIQAGIDARIRPGTPAFETAVVPSRSESFGFLVQANNVVINGFTVRDGEDGCGICISGSVSGTRVINNIVKNNVAGVRLNNAGDAQAVIRHNVFDSNNAPGAWSGNAIFSDETLRNAAVLDNSFSGHLSAAFIATFTSRAVKTSDVTFQRNKMNGDGSVALYYASDVRILDNRFTNPVRPAVVVGGGNDGIEILANHFSGAPAITLPVVLDPDGDIDPSKNVVIRFNGFEMTAPAAISIASGRYLGSLHAENNYWGCRQGAAVSTGTYCGVAKAPAGVLITKPWLPLPVKYGDSKVWSDGVGTTLQIHAWTGDFGFVYAAGGKTTLCTGDDTVRSGNLFFLLASCGTDKLSGAGALNQEANLVMVGLGGVTPYTLPWAWAR
jgi:hypothetical protein